MHNVKELVLAPVNKESIIEHGVAEKIITILGEHAVDTLVEILLVSPTLCSFKVIYITMANFIAKPIGIIYFVLQYMY